MHAALAPGLSLVDRCLSGERGAWAELHRVYHPQALGFLRRLGVSPSDADDACQEVFVQVFRYLARFERRADFRTWLYKLCVSQAARVRRRRRLSEPLRWLLGGGRQPSAEPPPFSPSSEAALVERALATLGAGYRTVFVLFELEGLRSGEIARVLQCPEGTVRRRLHEARRKFDAYVRDGSLEGAP